MPNAIPIKAGDTFERWTVISLAKSRYGQRMWLCRCQCGTEREVCTEGLVHRKSRSCGCIRVEALIARGPHNKTHGETDKTTEYVIWADMRRRCRNPNDPAYHSYGGRGILVCDRWQNFEHFLADMGRRPSKRHSIERVDNDKGYFPGNVVWATVEQQCNNRRTNIYITFSGKSLTITQWASIVGIKNRPLTRRYWLGWTPEDLLTIRPGTKIRTPRSETKKRSRAD